jgi:hypothetical protein
MEDDDNEEDVELHKSPMKRMSTTAVDDCPLRSTKAHLGRLGKRKCQTDGDGVEDDTCWTKPSESERRCGERNKGQHLSSHTTW